jgi:hypothetical protein
VPSSCTIRGTHETPYKLWTLLLPDADTAHEQQGDAVGVHDAHLLPACWAPVIKASECDVGRHLQP